MMILFISHFSREKVEKMFFPHLSSTSNDKHHCAPYSPSAHAPTPMLAYRQCTPAQARPCHRHTGPSSYFCSAAYAPALAHLGWLQPFSDVASPAFHPHPPCHPHCQPHPRPLISVWLGDQVSRQV